MSILMILVWIYLGVGFLAWTYYLRKTWDEVEKDYLVPTVIAVLVVSVLKAATWPAVIVEELIFLWKHAE